MKKTIFVKKQFVPKCHGLCGAEWKTDILVVEDSPYDCGYLVNGYHATTYDALECIKGYKRKYTIENGRVI